MSEWVFAFGIAGLFIGGSWFAAVSFERYLRRRALRRIMAQMSEDLQAVADVIGAALLPSLRELTRVLNRFAQVWNR